MPAEQAGQGAQPENATTPQVADEPTIAAATQQAETDAAGMMDALGIPKEIQGQVKPKEVDLKFGSDIPEPEAEAQPDTKPETPPPDKDDEEEDEVEVEEEEVKPAAEQSQKPDKRQKRINRLTRQKHELEAKLDQYATAYEQLKAQVTKGEEAPKEAPLPTGRGRLAHVTSERDLKSEIAKAEAIIEWCDANAEGATVGEGEQEVYHSATDIDRWRREAEKIVITAPLRREEIREYTAEREYFDDLAKGTWPQLFDKGTKEFQVASAILDQFPSIKASPQAQYAVGLVLEGMKAVAQRTPRQGANGRRGDIDSRAFTTPRVPIAPHSPGPPTREATPSSHKKLNEAWSNLVKDPDGGTESLADAFAAMDQAEKRGTTDSRTRVRS